MALWVLGPSSGADQQGHDKASGPRWQACQACVRAAEPASGCRFWRRLTGELRRSRVGRWLWQPRRARQGRRGRGSRVAPSIAAAKASFSRPQIKPGGQSQPKPNLTPTRLDLHDSGQNALSLTSPHLHCSQPLSAFCHFSFLNSPWPCWRDCSFHGHFPSGLSRSRAWGSAWWCDREARHRGGL